MALPPIFTIRGRDETAEAWASVQRNASAALGKINGLLPGLGVALSAAGLIAFAKQAFDSAEQLNNLSQRTGIAVEDLSALKFVAEQSNVGIESLALGIKKLSVNAFAAAADVKGEAAVAFRTLGVSATDANGKLRPTQDLLLSMADRFSKMQDPVAKTALAVKVFGKTGDELIPFLDLGSAGIGALTAEAQRLGLVMSTESAQAAQRFNDNMKALGSTATALGIELVNNTAPAMARITGAMREALAEGGPLRALFIGLGGVLAESLGLGMKEASEKARDLTRDLAVLQRNLGQLATSSLSPDALKRETDKINAQISAKRKELEVLQAQVKTEARQQEKNTASAEFIAQVQKDQQAADSFIATLKKEAETFGLSREQIIRYNAAKVAAGLLSVDIAIKLRNEAAALAAKIGAQIRAKEADKAAIKTWNEGRDAQIKAVSAIVSAANARNQESDSWRLSNDARKDAQLLHDLEAAGVAKESEAYRNLQEKLNSASGRLEYYNELRGKIAAREGGLKTLEAEIAQIRFETIALRLNNDQRARAEMIRKLQTAGLASAPGIVDNSAAIASADAAAAAASARSRELAEQRTHLDQRQAQLGSAMAAERRIEEDSYAERFLSLARDHANGFISAGLYKTEIENLDKGHADRMLAMEEGFEQSRFSLSESYRKLGFAAESAESAQKAAQKQAADLRAQSQAAANRTRELQAQRDFLDQQQGQLASAVEAKQTSENDGFRARLGELVSQRRSGALTESQFNAERERLEKTHQDRLTAIEANAFGERTAIAAQFRLLDQQTAQVQVTDPQAAELMDEFDQAQADKKAEQRRIEAENNTAALDQQSAQLILSLRTDEEMQQAHFVAENELLAQSWAEKLITEDQYLAAMDRLRMKYAKKSLEQRFNEEKQKAGMARIFGQVTLNDAAFFANQMGALMQTNSRKLFEIGKAGAIAGAIIDTYKAATGAYAALASIPFVGPALGAAAAAAAIAVGLARVQAIKSTTMGGGGAVGTFAANPSTGLPESPTSSGFEPPPAPAPSQGVPAQAPRVVNITFTGSGRYTQEEIREALIPALQDAFDAGVTVRF